MLLSLPQEKAQGRSAHYKLTSTVMLWLQVTAGVIVVYDLWCALV